MNRIQERFQRLATSSTPAFIPYITAGDPTLDATAQLILELERVGADIIELGVPFSDPVADGVVNQEAAQRALQHNVSLHDVVAMVKNVRRRCQVPLVLFTYFNPVLAYGLEQFAEEAAAAGVDGVLCVDLPPEESQEYKRLLDARGIATIFLISPTSTNARIELIARHCSGFVYYVSRTGVTGERREVEQTVRAMVQRIKQHTDTPVAVGFGISTPDQAAEVAGYADGVIVGSAIVRLIGEIGNNPGWVPKVGKFVQSLVDATKTKGASCRT
ncbi:MAG: tryptophan synthase subunit alpha [Candidatus Hydrogenedentes bacterium]|nr:tryptophan synthase subunit alpha [Candidatus Hydrogenedentota bacterium]